jgi:hypothetical protein
MEDWELIDPEDYTDYVISEPENKEINQLPPNMSWMDVDGKNYLTLIKN